MPTIPPQTREQAVAALLRLVGLDTAVCDGDTILCRDVYGESITAGQIVDCLRPDLKTRVEYLTAKPTPRELTETINTAISRMGGVPTGRQQSAGVRALRAAKRGGRKAAAK